MKKLVLVLIFLLSAGCVTKPALEAAPATPATDEAIPVAWQPLIDRLKQDGIYAQDLEPLFLALGPLPSEDPMGRKIKELYTKAFLKPVPITPKLDSTAPKTTPPKSPLRLRVYQGVVTAENIQRCREFLAANAQTFAQAQKTYGVPKEIAVSLLFVETKLGTFMGKESAFLTLASMSASTKPQAIPSYLNNLPKADQHLDWISEKMVQRSDWAYKELIALIDNFRSAKYNPLALPGSIYGAVGLCQFMPSNIEPYGADGDGDGAVNLFTLPDAVSSLSNYLVQHGWKNKPNRLQQHKALKSYNRVDIYANTILALADAVGKKTK